MNEMARERTWKTTNLAGNPALELNRRIVVDEFEFLKYGDALFVVGDEFQILVRDGHFEAGDIRTQKFIRVDDVVLQAKDSASSQQGGDT
jgi:hypothetical protein